MVVIDNKLNSRISTLSQKNKKTFNQQLELMVETFEIMAIQKMSYLPGSAGRSRVPIIEVSEPVIRRGNNDK